MFRITRYFEAADPRLWGEAWGGVVTLNQKLSGNHLRHYKNCKKRKDRQGGVYITVSPVSNPIAFFAGKNMTTGKDVYTYYQLLPDGDGVEVSQSVVKQILIDLNKPSHHGVLESLDDVTLIAALKARGYALIRGK